MYVPDEKMKINKFRVVAIPRPIEYMQRFGTGEMPSSSYSGDEFAPLPRDKVSMLVDAERYDSMMQDVERKREADESDSYQK